MKVIDRLYRRDELKNRTVHIDQDLYSQLQHLSKNVFSATVSTLINISIENTLLKNKPIKFYAKPENTDSIYRSILLRKTFYDELIKLRKETGISFSRLLNGCIKEFLEDFKDEF